MERIRMCLLDPDLAKINTEKSHIKKHKIYYFPCKLFFRPIFNSMVRIQDPWIRITAYANPHQCVKLFQHFINY